MSKKTSLKVIKIVLAVVLVIAVAVGAFLLYDSPAQYVKDQDGGIYLNQKGEPILYYTDMFGKTFEVADGKRVYCAIPAYIEEPREPATEAPELPTDNSVA